MSRVALARSNHDEPAFVRSSADRGLRPHVLSQGLFRDALLRERKRADRSNEPFLLLLVELDGDATIWRSVATALTAGKRETDILGWFSDQSVLGVLMPELVSGDASTVWAIETRLRREIAKRLLPGALASLTIRLHVHHQSGHSSEFERVDPLIAQPEPPVVDAVLKRALDIAGSLALLVVLSPLLLLIALLVKITSKGPVFFRQTRVGQMEKPFKMLKFRSMRVGVDHAIHQEFVTNFIKSSAKLNEPGGGGSKDARFKIANDPRVTPVGAFLRKTSLDELPQFFNVLQGSMSLVGPRPPLQYEVDQYAAWHCRRVREAKPGITGLWQVKGRSRTTFDEMVRLDLRYAKAPSVWTDIKILLATPAAVISGKGAC